MNGELRAWGFGIQALRRLSILVSHRVSTARFLSSVLFFFYVSFITQGFLRFPIFLYFFFVN